MTSRVLRNHFLMSANVRMSKSGPVLLAVLHVESAWPIRTMAYPGMFAPRADAQTIPVRGLWSLESRGLCCSCRYTMRRVAKTGTDKKLPAIPAICPPARTPKMTTRGWSSMLALIRWGDKT